MRNRVFAVVVLIIVAISLQYQSDFTKIDQILCDSVYQKEQSVTSSVKIIAIDEATLMEYGNFGSWDRQIYADLIEILTSVGDPKFIGFDILFSGEITEEGDQNFADACEKYGNVCVVNQIVFCEDISYFDGEISIDNMSIYGIDEPYAALKEATIQGFSNTVIDSDGAIRDAIYSIDYNEETVYSFACEIADAIAEIKGIDIIEPAFDSTRIYSFDYSGTTGSYETISLVDVLDGTVDPAVFVDTIVVVGAYSAGLQDAYSTSIDSSQMMYGVEININIAEAIVGGNTYLDIDANIFNLLLIIIILLVLFVLTKFNVFWSAIIVVMINVIYFVSCIYLHEIGVGMPLLMVPLTSIAMYIIYVVIKYVSSRRRQREIVDSFKRYVAPQVVDSIIDNKGNLTLNPRSKDCAIMFADIRGFTTMSENMKSSEVVDFLNKYFEITTEIVFQNEGTLDKFIGDAVMAVFNSPFDVGDYVYKCIKTAVELKKSSNKLKEYVKIKYDKDIGIGIGINCGNVTAGNVGNQSRYDFTVIGDDVNIAARLESKAKKDQILISENVKLLVEDRVELRCLGNMDLKGKSESVVVYEVIDIL